MRARRMIISLGAGLALVAGGIPAAPERSRSAA